VLYFLLDSVLDVACGAAFLLAAWVLWTRRNPGWLAPRLKVLAILHSWARRRGPWSLVTCSPLVYLLGQTGLLFLAVWWFTHAMLLRRDDRRRGVSMGEAAAQQFQWAVGAFLLSLIINFAPMG